MPIGRLVSFFGKIFLSIVGGIIVLILVLKLIFFLFETLAQRTSKPVQRILLAMISLAVLGWLYWLPRSDSLLLQSWKAQTGKVAENSTVFEMLLGAPGNKYYVDALGRIVELKLGHLGVQDIAQLPHFFDLNSLQRLEISDPQLQGTIDLSRFKDLEELHLHNTHVSKVTGLENLPNLKTVDLAGSSVETVGGIGGAKGLVLSRTSVTDLSQFANASSLEALSIEDTNLAPIQGFQFLKHIKLVSLRGCTNVNLRGVANLASLKALLLDHSDVADLNPLRPLHSLQIISLVDTRVLNLAGIENLDIQFLGTNNPAFTSEYVQAKFGHPVLLGRDDVFTHLWIPARVRSMDKKILLLLLIVLILSVVPLTQRRRYQLLVKLRRIALRMIPGALIVLVLWTVASLDIPFAGTQEARPAFLSFLGRLAWFAAFLWLGLLPVLMLLRDTRIVRNSFWSVPCFFFSRFIPGIVIAGTVMSIVGDGISSMFSKPGGVVVLFGVAAVFLLLGLLMGMLALSLHKMRKDAQLTNSAADRTVRRLLYFPFAVVIVLISVSAYIFLNLQRLSQNPGSTLFLCFLAFPSIFAISLLIRVVIDSGRWIRDRRRVKSVLRGDRTGSPCVLEIPIRQGVIIRNPAVMVGRLFIGSAMAFLKDMISPLKEVVSPTETELDIVSAQNVGQVGTITCLPSIHVLRGLIIIMQRSDFESSHMWELQRIQNLIQSVYRNTWAPIWLVGDWFERLDQHDERLKARISIVESFMPFLNDIETFSAPNGTIYDPQPPKQISDCLNLNKLVRDDVLTAGGVETIIQKAFTPVAILFRSVFGQAEVVNRLDALVKAAEIAVATFTLLMMAEHEHLRAGFSAEENDQIDRGVNRAFAAQPSFGDWIGLFETFCKRRLTRLTADMSERLSTAAHAEVNELRAMIEVIAGDSAVSQVASVIKTRRQILPLLSAIRNVVTAHGPATERAGFPLYEKALTATLNFLDAFPWSDLIVQAAAENGQTVIYQGALPSFPDHQTWKSNAHLSAIYHPADEAAESRFDISRYFLLLSEGRQIAFYTGQDQFLEPVFGEHVSANHEIAA